MENNINIAELILKDLCTRIPYGVKVESVFINPDTKERKSCGIEVFDATSLLMIRDGLGEFKPYLFPFEGMTDEQYKEYWELEHSGDMEHLSIPALDWLNKNHFDYRGLIEKGLAIDATSKNIY
jgi:hypothetical protein